MTYVLEVRQLDKRFGATHALRKVDFNVARGEVVALLGENGAGKSTLTKIIAGETKPDNGEVKLDGTVLRLSSTADAIKAGISRMPQELQVMRGLSVHENLYAGHMPYRKKLAWTSLIDRKRSLTAARILLDEFGIDLPMEKRCSSLTFAQQQLVMLFRALTHDVKVLILDEPTAALERKEVELLFQVVKGLSRRGVAVIYITHRLPEIKEITTRAVVMRDGEVVRVVPREEYDGDQLSALLMGNVSPITRSAQNPREPASGAIEIDLLGSRKLIPRGRVTGYTGLLGSGVETLLADAFGLMQFEGNLKTGFISGERNTQAFYDMSVFENICAPHLASFSKLGWLDVKKARRATRSLIQAFDIRPAEPDKLMRELSGGNQQKVLLARWFMHKMDALLLAEPTTGVDIGAKQLIQHMINEYRAQGGTVLLSSTDYDELIVLCDQIVPVLKGVVGNPINRENGFCTNSVRHAIGAS